MGEEGGWLRGVGGVNVGGWSWGFRGLGGSGLNLQGGGGAEGCELRRVAQLRVCAHVEYEGLQRSAAVLDELWFESEECGCCGWVGVWVYGCAWVCLSVCVCVCVCVCACV